MLLNCFMPSILSLLAGEKDVAEQK